MTKSIKLGTLSLVVSALLVGCGSDSSSSDNSTVDATIQTDDTLIGL
jgi:outer membrane biogenesis lipoprotein LolB